MVYFLLEDGKSRNIKRWRSSTQSWKKNIWFKTNCYRWDFHRKKELIGAYYNVSVENYDKVIEIAQDFPDYHLGGTVEIREVMDFDR